MPLLADPIPIQENDPAAAYYYNTQLRAIYMATTNLSLTIRDTAIQNNDKAGNLQAVYVTFTSNGVANTEDTVPHVLGFVPKGYIAVKQDKAAILYDGTTAFTTTNLYLRSSVATVVWTVLVF